MTFSGGCTFLSLVLNLWGKRGVNPNFGHKSGRKGDNGVSETENKVRFVGSFNHSLDCKGRLVIPQNFREKLGEKFCVAPGFDFKSIAIYPTAMWEKRCESYERLGNMNPALNRYLEQFYALSFDGQMCDGQGRVLLPANIRQKILSDEKDVEITGANDHIRVVSAEVSRNSWESFNNELPALLEMIAGLENHREE